MAPPESDHAAVPPAAVEGTCDRRFAPVREAFEGNFRERGELGAALCVMVDGRVVMNQMGPRWQNPRTRALIGALSLCL